MRVVPKLKAMIAYLSYSGNTKETAECIEKKLRSMGIETDTHCIGVNPVFNPEDYDVIFLGTFTWGKGATPDEVKEFVLGIGWKPPNIAIFGTGETQFGGDELFCSAAVKLAAFYNSKWPPLKIEQSPRGSQEAKIESWTEGVIKDERNLA